MSNTLKTDQKIIPADEYLKTLPGSGEEYIIKKAAESRAKFDPLPGPMGDALECDSSIQVQTSTGVVNVRKLKAYDITLFKKFNSPFYRQLLESEKAESEREDIKYEDEDSYAMVYQFINSPRTVKAAADKGKEFFDNIALEEVSLEFDLSDIKAIIEAISTQIIKSFSTMVKHGSEEKSGLDEMISKYADKDDQRETVKKK